MLPKNREEKVYLAVRKGWFKIRKDGSIWRVRQRRRTRWGTITLRDVKPHRIDMPTTGGYGTVKFMIDGIQYSCPAHRLVWRHFHGRIPPNLTINHKNGKKSDNRPKNLELATHSEQTLHAYKMGLKDEYGEKNPASKLTDAQVVAIRLRYAKGRVTLEMLAQKYGVRFQQISRIVRGDRRPMQGGPTADYTHRRQRLIKRNKPGRFFR